MSGERGPIGQYRRVVRLTSDGSVSTAEMEDDVHHFRLRLTHESGTVTALEGEAIRTPWTICPGALARLDDLVGLTLEQVRDLGASERAEHCLHLYDLAILAANHAREAGFARSYAIEADHDQDPPLLSLWRDGDSVLAWRVAKGRIVGSRFDGLRFAELGPHLAELTPDEAEAAIVLRRASLISSVRRLDLDAFPSSFAINPNSAVNCYVKQPVRHHDALRAYGNSRDFSGTGTWPLDTPPF